MSVLPVGPQIPKVHATHQCLKTNTLRLPITMDEFVVILQAHIKLPDFSTVLRGVRQVRNEKKSILARLAFVIIRMTYYHPSFFPAHESEVLEPLSGMFDHCQLLKATQRPVLYQHGPLGKSSSKVLMSGQPSSSVGSRILWQLLA